MAVFSRAEKMSLISSSRRPGGQPGNTNALKHGFYARKLKSRRLADYARARTVTGLDEEIALLRLVILNLVESCLPAPGGPPDLAACSALEASLARLSHLLKDRRLLASPSDLGARGARHLREAEPFGIETAAPGQVADDEVEGVVAEDSERIRHAHSLDPVSAGRYPEAVLNAPAAPSVECSG